MKPTEISKYKPCTEAVEYRNKYKHFKNAWRYCPRGDWMLWLAYKAGVDKRTLTLAKALCAKTVIHLMKDERSVNAVNVAESYGRGNATEEELNIARNATDAYAVYAAAAYAADAAAAYAAAAYAVYAAAAYAAAAYAADAAARAKNQKQTADICREILTEQILKLIK